MKDVLEYLTDRKEEFDRHLAVARMLEARVDKDATDEELAVEVRHVNTVKSGLLIHLYNIVEAVTTRTLEAVGVAVATERPRQWTEQVLAEWVRAEIWAGDERIGEGALKRLTGVSRTLAVGDLLKSFKVKGEPGSWDDKAISRVADRLGCRLEFPVPIRRAAFEPAYRNETTALEFLAQRRNAIAHGATTFEEGADYMTLDDLAALAGRVLPFLESVSSSYASFIANKGFLRQEGEAA